MRQIYQVRIILRKLKKIYIWILTPASGIIECKLTRLHRRKAGKSNEEQSDKRGSSGASEDI